MRKLLLLYGNDTMVINSTTYEGYSHLMLFIKHHHFSFLLFPRRTPEKQVYRMRMISSSFSTKGSTFNYKTFKKRFFLRSTRLINVNINIWIYSQLILFQSTHYWNCFQSYQYYQLRHAIRNSNIFIDSIRKRFKICTIQLTTQWWMKYLLLIHILYTCMYI